MEPNAQPSPINGHEAAAPPQPVPNQGIPQHAVPEVSQHIDANQKQEQHHEGAPPNVVGQQPPQVVNAPGH